MHQKLLEIPFLHLPIYSYGFMVVLGFLVSILVLSRRAGREGIPSELILDIGLIGMLAGIIGARIAYLIIYHNNYNWVILNIFDGNLNIYGGIIGWFVPFFLLFIKKKNQNQSVRKESSFNRFMKLLVYSFICAIVGARLAHLGIHYSEYDWGIFQIWQGGLVFYGGLILSVISGIVYLRIKNIPVLKIGDLIAPGIMLGEVFGRLGCFLNGCCYGAPANLPWSVCFPEHSPAYVHQVQAHIIPDSAASSLPVHPTQLYSSIIALILFFVLSFIWSHRKRDGIVLGSIGILYPLSRFMIEFIRGDNPPVFLGMTASQTISMAVIIISAIFLFSLRSKQQLSKTD
ncbi:MAG: prolipoprotein diacylglyceryl transferase [Planctomycetota bacterium]